MQGYVAGLNAAFKKQGTLVTPYTARDVVAVGALLAARFGANGGSETRRSMFLDALQKELGATKGRQVFDDLRAPNDVESPVIAPGPFPFHLPPPTAPGSVVIDDGSFTPRERLPRRLRPSRAGPASNALLVGAKRSKTGHPVLVGGPQVGYFFPQFFMEVDLHGGGYDVRGALLPGLPLVLVGRGPDFAWTVTSSQADNIDVFAETLCGGDDRHYLYRGDLPRDDHAGCRDAALGRHARPAAAAAPDGSRCRPGLRHRRRVAAIALAQQRSTRGREVLSARALYELDTGRVTSAKSFVKTVSTIEAMFNFFYVDDRDIAHVTAGRLPVRAAGHRPVAPDGRHGRVRLARLPRRRRRIPRRSTRARARSSTGTRSPPAAGARPTTTGRTARFSARSC